MTRGATSLPASVGRGATGRSRSAVTRAAAFMALLSASGCISSGDLKSYEAIGSARPPISPASVQLYLEAPSRRYEQIAVLRASSLRSWSFTSQSKADVVVRRLKQEAAALGANGMLLQEITDEHGTAIGAGMGGTYMGARGIADLGIGVSVLPSQRYGRGIAIYLPP